MGSDARRYPTYRIRKQRLNRVNSASYRHSLTVVDEHTQETLATCDLLGRASTSELAIVDASEARYSLKPNRSVLPSCWTLTEASGQIALRIDGQVTRKLVAPLTRTALVLLDVSDEPLRLVDKKSSLGDLVMGLNPSDWSLLRGEETVALLTRLPRRPSHPKGLRGWILNAFTLSDRGLVSLGDGHAISAPAALAMVALFDDFTDAAG